MAEKKTFKELDKNDFAAKLTDIVEELHKQDASRAFVTEIVNELSSTYGLKKPTIRAAAKIIYKHNLEEVEESNKEVMDLVDLYT
tara:strand:- start:14 stop:268 length:255 start_codon:yes stop_codon:yes gene_type:complete